MGLESNKATIPPQPYAQRFYEHFRRNIQGGADPLEPLPPWEGSGRGSDVPPYVARSSSEAITYYSCHSFQEVDALKCGLDTPTSNGKDGGENERPRRRKGSTLA